MFCAARMLEHLVGLLQRRVGAADDLREIGAAAGEAGAELVEDQRQRCRYGRRMMLLIRSRSTGVVVCVDRQQVLALPVPALDLRQRRRRLACPARGCVGVHSTNFSPISDCGRIVQVASVRKSWKPGSSMSARPPPCVRRDVERLDLADLHAGDLTSSPGITKPALSKIARTW